MGRNCSICSHPQRSAIDRALLNPDLSYSQVQKLFPGIHAKSLARHKEAHLLQKVKAATGAADLVEAEEYGSIAAHMEDLRVRAMDILAKAERAGNLKAALHAIREARGTLEASARFSGLDASGQTVVNVIAAPAFVTVQTHIVAALAPFPEARAAVATALGKLPHA